MGMGFSLIRSKQSPRQKDLPFSAITAAPEPAYDAPEFPAWGRMDMNLEKVIFGFFVIFSCTMNFGFFVGALSEVAEHDAGHLFAAVVINLIALVLKFGDRTHIGATHLATSMVALLQLLAASSVWVWHVNIGQSPMSGGTMATIVSLSGGALLANLISVVLLIGETLRQTR